VQEDLSKATRQQRRAQLEIFKRLKREGRRPQFRGVKLWADGKPYVYTPEERVRDHVDIEEASERDRIRIESHRRRQGTRNQDQQHRRVVTEDQEQQPNDDYQSANEGDGDEVNLETQ